MNKIPGKKEISRICRNIQEERHFKGSQYFPIFHFLFLFLLNFYFPVVKSRSSQSVAHRALKVTSMLSEGPWGQINFCTKIFLFSLVGICWRCCKGNGGQGFAEAMLWQQTLQGVIAPPTHCVPLIGKTENKKLVLFENVLGEGINVICSVKSQPLRTMFCVGRWECTETTSAAHFHVSVWGASLVKWAVGWMSHF